MNLETAYERGFEEGERLAKRREWQNLTDEQIAEIRKEWETHDYRLSELCRIIEAAVREMNE